MKKYTKGFTLIELLVVIAIIGILASVVLVSLNSARKKGNDTRVIADVQQTRTALEANYTGSGYSSLDLSTVSATANTAATINASSLIATLNSDAVAQQGSLTIVTTASAAAAANITAYAIYGKLVSNPSNYFCIDSTGNTSGSAGQTQHANSNC